MMHLPTTRVRALKENKQVDHAEVTRPEAMTFPLALEHKIGSQQQSTII